MEDNGFRVMHRFIRSQHLSAAGFTGGTKAEPQWKERLSAACETDKSSHILHSFSQGEEVTCHVCKKHGAEPK